MSPTISPTDLPPTICLIGTQGSREIRQIQSTLHGPVQWKESVADLLMEAEAGRGGPRWSEPEIVILVQRLPGQYSPEEINLLRRSLPLTRIVVVVGNWCEGETRTGRPHAGVPRIYWHDTTDLLRTVRRIIQLPPTASNVEFVLACRREPAATSNLLILIAAAQLEDYQPLAECLASCGYRTVWNKPGAPLEATGASLLVWNHPWQDRQFRQFQQVYRRLGPLPCVVLLDFPRIEDVEFLKALGVEHVLSKPICEQELLATVADLPQVSRSTRLEPAWRAA